MLLSLPFLGAPFLNDTGDLNVCMLLFDTRRVIRDTVFPYLLLIFHFGNTAFMNGSVNFQVGVPEILFELSFADVDGELVE